MTDKEIVEPEIISFCKRCRAPKVADREYCCYCVGRHEVKNRPLRVRVAYRLMPAQLKLWFVFHLGHDKQYAQLIPEHLRKGDWRNIEAINRPSEIKK